MKSSPSLLAQLRDNLPDVANIYLRVRSIVEGTLHGLHASPYHGFSSEFHEYRAHNQGEPATRLDWRKYAKTGRSYVRLSRDESNLRAWIVLDTSASMAFAHQKRCTKLEYAKTVAGCFAWLLMRQRDATGLMVFAQTQVTMLPPRISQSHLLRLITALNNCTPAGITACGSALSHLARTITRRGLICVISDCFDDPHAIGKGLHELRLRGHDVILIRVLDPLESTFSLSNSTTLTDLETGTRTTIDGALSAKAFAASFTQHAEILARVCAQAGVTCITLTTTSSISQALMAILDKRRHLA